MKTIRNLAMIMTVSVLLLTSGCFGKKVILPTYDSALEQYVFAKRTKDRAYLVIDRERRQKDFEHAILAYRKVLERFPEDERFTPLAMIGVAECYYAVDDFKNAAKTYEEALKKYPDQSDIQASALYGAGDAYDRMKEYEKAQFYFRECIERFEDDERPFIKSIVETSNIRYGKIKEK